MRAQAPKVGLDFKRNGAEPLHLLLGADLQA